MKLIVGIIKPFKLDDVKDALKELGVNGLTVSDVQGFGRQRGHTEVYRGAEYEIDFIPKVRVEILVDDGDVDRVTAKLVEATHTQPLYEGVSNENGYEDFEWVAVEQKLAAAAIETDSQKGWAFFELDAVDPSKGGAPRAHVDALRLLAVFLAHWDNKAENQRLVCLSETWPPGARCPEPFLLLQDVGSTFGPDRVDLEAWKAARIWEDRHACKVSMSDLPYGGGTFGPTRVSERGRRFLARLLEQLTDAQLTDLFAGARFDEPRNPWYRTSPVPEWVIAFKARVRAISEGPPCPDA